MESIMNQTRTKLTYWLAVLIFLAGCSSSDEQSSQSKSPRIKSLSKIESPANGSTFTIGDTVDLQISVVEENINIDSVEISLDGTIVAKNSTQWITKNAATGKKNLLISIYLSNGKVEKKRQTYTFLSDIEPTRYTYRVVNSYVHDPDAFTQGLLVDDNQLYESTGERGFSSLRKVDVKTGKVLKQIDISSQYFGEGIAVIRDHIYMLSWKEGTGFVYDKNSFEEIRQFSYTFEGWGMTSKDDTLLVSDGTHIIRFMDPEGFGEYRQIQVYDQNGPIDYLNELEYVNGDLFGIRWQTESIYIIDPQTGKVNGVLDLEGIFDFSLYDRRIDVLNGIAFNPETNQYFVTGKWWPKLFEIQLITSNNI